MVATSLISLDTILPEICTCIVGFSCTLWTIMRSLAGSLAGIVLADALLFFPQQPVPPTNLSKVRVP